MHYTLNRSRRKSAAIHVRNGEVEVRAPLRMPKQEIDRFVLEKERWILKSLAKQQVQSAKKEAFAIDYGSPILFRGKPYPITNRNGTRAGFDDNEFYMPPGLSLHYFDIEFSISGRVKFCKVYTLPCTKHELAVFDDDSS
jgi:predicted metal-dependent hydrolase